jgi:TonB-dependent SusC/RagA subfamily outer membrane receptor
VVDGYLSGKVPGVMIRGINSIDGNNAPLLIIDGLPYAGKLDDLDPSLIVNTNVLKGEAATAIYGAQAAGGVLIITTKGAKLNAAETPGSDGPVASSLRQHFRDYAYWQPRLKTDLAGKATFTVTYPDDITAWRSFAMVMGNDRQTGSAEGLVRSYKAISGNLALPQFAVTSDSITTIGKALNYGMDTLEVKRHFYVNDQLLHHRLLRFRNAWIDTFAVVAPAGDSLKLKYTVQKEDGYLDGEERSLPLFAPGVVETTGFFAALPKDTSFTLQAFPDTGMVTIYAESSVLPTLEKEVESLRTYEYLCNEQIASKLKALLVQKRIDSFLKRPFRYDKNIRELIGKLSQGKSTTGLWGWWPNTDPMIWVSLHAVEALVEAGKQGYAVSLNKPALVDYLLLTLEKWGRTDKLSALRLLQMLDARADYKRYTDSLERHLPNMNLYEKLRFAEIKQVAGLNYTLDSMLVRRSETMFGNVYWGEEGYRFFDNAIQNSLLMYRLLKNGGNQSDLLEKLRGYFLEKRRTGHWRNTYESSLILETILPDLLVNDSLPKASMLTLSGTTESTINRFPFSTEIRGIAPITIKKEGSQPVYFTTYHQRWNTAPKKVAGEFTVNTAFVKNNQPLTILKAGEPVELKIDVAVKSEAQYVMIEVPIPAGCSYKEKAQGHRNNEVHREYFKNKVSIFCSSLKKGEYTFTVSLLPRYTGRYTLNPAKAEMMYFPVFYGREEIRKVRIE